MEPVPGGYWAVIRRGQPLADGGRPFAVYREGGPPLCTAAGLPALAMVNHLQLGEQRKRLGVPLEQGRHHVGRLGRPEPALLPILQAAVVLAARPEGLAFLFETAGVEGLAILGRAPVRRVEGNAG